MPKVPQVRFAGMAPVNTSKNATDGRANHLAGDSQMAVRTREFRWDSTSLGSLGEWSESLLSAVNSMLASPLSTILMAGVDLVSLYNDAYIPTLAERHPSALGVPGALLWADAWPAVGHQIEAVRDQGRSFHFENVLIPVDRNGVLTDTYFTYSFSPIFEARESSVAGVLCVAQDVTATHQTSLDLEENQRKLAALAEELDQVMAATTDAVISVNRNWQFSYLNDAGIRTYAQGRDLLGKKLWEEFPDAVYPGSPYVEHYERAMYQGESGSFEAYYPEPLDIWIRLSVFPTADGFVTFSRNITEEKRSASVLLQNEKLAAVGRLAASIAHEINNPLESVTNLLYLARRSQSMPEVQEYLDTAERELRRVSVISNQTLRFHKQASAPTVVTCNELFEEVLSIYQGRLVNSRISVEMRQRADRPFACFDGEIRQVMTNLIGNAIDAMHPQGGRLLIRSREGTNWRSGQKGVVLTVADTGTGMPQQVLRKIFEAFYTTKGIGGTGLGLWVSKEIVDRHRGALLVRTSQNEMHSGTVFALFLPFDDGRAA